MEAFVFVLISGLSIIGLFSLDRDRMRRLDSDDFFEDDEYFSDHK